MHNGPFERSMVWMYEALLRLSKKRLRAYLSLPLVLLLALTSLSLFFTLKPARASSLSREINSLRDEVSRLRSFIPGLGYPTPSPTEIEELAENSPSKARILLKKAKKKYMVEAEKRLKVAIAEIGHSIETNPTNAENYSNRRKLLAELENLFKAQRKPVVGLFPKGAPSSRLAKSSSSQREYDYCDEVFSYLANLFKDLKLKNSPSPLSSSSGSSDADPFREGEPESGKDGKSIDSSRDPFETESPGRTRGKTSWKMISTYFQWSIYFLTAVALLGLLYHLKRGASSFTELTTAALDEGGKELAISEVSKEPEEAFKQGLSHFQKARYKKALPAFKAVGNSKHHERDRALYYAVLTEIRLGDTEAACRDFDLIPEEALTAEEYYRLGKGFEEGDCLEMAKLMYESVKKEDETFRDVLHRLGVIERKLCDKSEG